MATLDSMFSGGFSSPRQEYEYELMRQRQMMMQQQMAVPRDMYEEMMGMRDMRPRELHKAEVVLPKDIMPRLVKIDGEAITNRIKQFVA